MKYLSVCSGIEAATVAWHHMGWEPVAFSEIEKFPSQVLAHHYPAVPNWGDMTKFKEWPDATIDVFVGGTPCQSFSVAGLRKGLADPRGNLMLTYLAIAAKYRPKWVVWENVPGVLSSNGGNDFASLLRGLGELGYGFAYRILDAQYFGVAQRRRRVFVVGCFGDWQRAAAVLFERHSLQGHPPPSRKKGQKPAPTISARTKGGDRLGTDFDCDGGLIPQGCGGEIAPTLNSAFGSKLGLDNQHIDSGAGLFVACPGKDGTDLMGTLTARMFNSLGVRDVEEGALLPVFMDPLNQSTSSDVAKTLAARSDMDGMGVVTHSLRDEGFDASEDGTGRGTPLVPVMGEPYAFPWQQGGTLSMSGTLGMSGTLVKNQTMAVAYGLPGNWIGRKPENGGNAVEPMHDLAPNLTSTDRHAVAFADVGATLKGNSGARGYPDPSDGNGHNIVKSAMQVRRLTCVECERLQGFPDGYTDIKPNGKPTADGPRYKALGNSMAVPVMRFIGERIASVEAISQIEEMLI